MSSSFHSLCHTVNSHTPKKKHKIQPKDLRKRLENSGTNRQTDQPYLRETNNITDFRRANCSQMTGERFASVVATWGLGMLAFGGVGEGQAMGGGG